MSIRDNEAVCPYHKPGAKRVGCPVVAPRAPICAGKQPSNDGSNRIGTRIGGSSRGSAFLGADALFLHYDGHHAGRSRSDERRVARGHGIACGTSERLEERD